MLTELLSALRGRATFAEPMPVVTVGVPVREYEAAIAQLTNVCVAMGLRKMLQARHFSICDLENLCQAARIIPDGDVVRALRCIHCVDWADMPRDTRAEIVRILVSMFTPTGTST